VAAAVPAVLLTALIAQGMCQADSSCLGRGRGRVASCKGTCRGAVWLVGGLGLLMRDGGKAMLAGVGTGGLKRYWLGGALNQA